MHTSGLPWLSFSRGQMGDKGLNGLKIKLDSSNSYRWAIKMLEALLYYLPVFAGFFWMIVSHRLLSMLLFPICLVVHRPRCGWRRRMIGLIVWGLFFASSIAPFDITFMNYPGPPRFVRYIAGYPSLEGTFLLMQDEAVWGGCMMHGNEPQWVLVW